MSMIKVQNLTFSYPSSFDNIFDNTSFQIDTDWKLGFVGRNGRGKTTFLNLLLGKYEYQGKIISSVKFDYFPYSVSDKAVFTGEVLREICPMAEEWELIKELSYLEVDDDVLWRPFETLSNGEQTKVLLAALFLNRERFLLIDEPTNHLDARARDIVSAYLKKKKGFILVSHDRAFLDTCIDHILVINKTNIEVQKGNFSSWNENRNRQEQFEHTKNERLKKQIHQLEQSAKRAAAHSDKINSTKIGFNPAKVEKSLTRRPSIAKKAGKLMNRAKSMENRIEKSIAEKNQLLKNVEEISSLKLSPLKYHSNQLITFQNVTLRYSGNVIFKDISFTVNQGDRIAVDGKNGSGKSSLLKLLMGYDIVHTGEIIKGSCLIISYVSQDTSHLKGSLSDFAKKNQINESLFKTILRKMDFERIQFEKSIEEFSGGQKKKVLLAKSLCEHAHLYVWDEPLNFIDIYSRMQIEQLIKEFSPTMIFVEHDKTFRNEIATKIIRL